jgi:hypothetical protein
VSYAMYNVHIGQTKVALAWTDTGSGVERVYIVNKVTSLKRLQVLVSRQELSKNHEHLIPFIIFTAALSSIHGLKSVQDIS